MIQSIFPEPKLRTRIQSFNFPHTVYLLAALIANLIIINLWTLLIFKLEKPMDILIAITGLINGFLAYLFMHYQNKYRLIIYSILFSLMSSFLSQYIYFMHFLNWEIATILNKDESGYLLVFNYIRYFFQGYSSVFLNFQLQHFTIFNYVWLIILVLAPFMYILFTEPEDENPIDINESTDINKNHKGRLIKRRFDF